MENIEKEIWKDVVGYEGIYQISNFGKVLSLSYRDKGYSKIRISQTDVSGYSVIDLHLNKKRKNFKIHRLVAIAFILNPENKPQINHKDGDKLNNYICNLEWCTASDNIYHAYRNGLNYMSERQKKIIFNVKAKKVMNIKTGEVFKSLTEVCKLNNITISHLSNMLTGKIENKTNLKYC